jgi:hypothetical protein
VEQLSCRFTDINKWHLLSETFWIFSILYYNSPFNLVLLVNDQLLMNVMDKVDANENLRSRALIVHLNAGDQLTVGVPTGYQVLATFYDVIFAGFLIQPDQHLTLIVD